MIKSAFLSYTVDFFLSMHKIILFFWQLAEYTVNVSCESALNLALKNCSVVSVSGTLFEYKMPTFNGECAQFSFYNFTLTQVQEPNLSLTKRIIQCEQKNSVQRELKTDKGEGRLSDWEYFWSREIHWRTESHDRYFVNHIKRSLLRKIIL
jgi:hypothetical protein